ncbi:unnamed protein product [Withania somnifera]
MEVAVKMTREREVLEVVDTRKRKKRDGDMEMSTALARVRSHSGVLSVSLASLESPANELSSHGNTVSCKPAVSDALASCCADNESSDFTKGNSKFVDLDEDSVEIATSNSEFRESREAIRSSKFQVELHKLELTPRLQHAKSRKSRRSTEAKMPSEADLDEFFDAAEKDLHKQFAEKYNFDFAKEEPLEGRYKWVRQ